MQIFLLMILSAFMGGYYYLGSPALNVAHDFLPESVRTKGLIMCVVNEHKRALDDNATNMRGNAYQFEQTSPCAKSKNVVTKKFCMIGEVISSGCYEKSSESETANYLSDHYFSTSVDLPKNINQNKILDFIKNMSGGLPNLGILFKTEDGEFVILNPQTTTDAVSIKQVLIGANSLRKGQIVYFSHHSPAEVEAIVQNAGFEALECKKETDIKVFNAEEQIWECRAFESLKKCFGDMLENENGDCIPNPDKKINCSSDMRAKFNYDASAWECQRRLSIACGEGETLSWLGKPLYKYICVSDAEWTDGECEELIQNSDGSSSTVRIGGTASGYPCNPCEIHQAGKCTDECFPDPNSVPENSCAGGDCGYDIEREGSPWRTGDLECGDDGNCEKHKAIYWHNDTNRWKCVDCFPLEIKNYTKAGDTNRKYRKCLNGNIWVINSDGEKELDISTACDQDGNYDALPANDYDGCYLTESDGLYCSFDGVGGFDDSGDGFGEKGFFCDIDHINDQEICEMNSSAWAWYDYISGNCYDPYDSVGELQPLPDGTAPTEYGVLSFGCPDGYYRARIENEQISECKKKFCNVDDDNLPTLLDDEFPYEARFPDDECSAGYVEILNDKEGEECFYCWIPPFDHDDYDLTEESVFDGVSYFKIQTTSKSLQLTESETFEYLLATEIGADCDDDNNHYCKDTVPAHDSPPGWKRTWDIDSRTWSDAEPFWCADNHYPTDENGDVDVNYLPTNTTNMRCPAYYQTKLDGINNGNTEILSACLYCLPEPFDINEVMAVYGALPTTPSPYITAPQQPGFWKIKNCNGIDAESIKTDQTELSPSDYEGSDYAYNNGQCALSSNTTGCADGLEREWDGSSWEDCSPIYCDDDDVIEASGYIIPNIAPPLRSGAYLPVQKSYEEEGETKYCIYMWRPPYDIAIWETWKINHSFENQDWKNPNFVRPDGYNPASDYLGNSPMIVDANGYVQTWINEEPFVNQGWDIKTRWCSNAYGVDILPTAPEVFPYTGKLDTECFDKAQPTLAIWIGVLGITIENSPDFREHLFSSCADPSDCSTTGDVDEAFIANKPLKSTWDETGGWLLPLVVENCESNSINSPATDNYFYYKKNSNSNYCADVWLPEYENWEIASCPLNKVNGTCPTFNNFNINTNPMAFPFYTCGTGECEADDRTPWVPGSTTGTCYQNISYREWTDISGWPSNCTVNMCLNETEEDDNMLLKGVEETRSVSIIEHCGENTIPVPHIAMSPDLKTDCNGKIGEHFDCFYEDGYSGGQYIYEEAERAKCSSNEDWDRVANWDDGWEDCADRDCVIDPEDPNTYSNYPPYNNANYDYLEFYYPPTTDASCGTGMIASGTSYDKAHPERKCRYCKADMADPISCPSAMHTFYIIPEGETNAGKVDCAFPAPPLCPDWNGDGILEFPSDNYWWASGYYSFPCDETPDGVKEPVIVWYETSELEGGSYSCVPGTYVAPWDIHEVSFARDVAPADSLICDQNGKVFGYELIIP